MKNIHVFHCNTNAEYFNCATYLAAQLKLT